MPKQQPISGSQARHGGQQAPLLDHLWRIEHNRKGYVAVYLHLSKLGAQNRQPTRIKIAATIIESYLSAHRFDLYILGNDDFVFLGREIETAAIDRAIAKLWKLFSSDPLLAGDKGEVMNRFVSWYDLASDYKGLLSSLREATKRIAQAQATSEPEKAPLQQMNPTILSAFNERLERVVLSDLIRRQTATFVNAQGVPGRPLFDEYYLSISDLKHRIAPKVDMPVGSWLFLYLTEGLDKRMLATMGQQDFAALAHPISLNLNISTIYAVEFKLFAKRVGRHTDKIVIEIQNADVWADIDLFEKTSDLLQEMGFRILIDGLTLLSPSYCDFSKLPIDMVKFSWSPDYLALQSGHHMSKLAERLAPIADRTVLSRVDTVEAVAFGIDLGINHFQGRYVEALLSAPDQQAKNGLMKRES